MALLKIVAVVALFLVSAVASSLVAPLPAIRYTQVAPPSVLPFSAQVSTFSRNLHVFDAPYAAGVIPGPPAIVQRALISPPAIPAPVQGALILPPAVPAPFLPYHYHPASPFAAPAPLLG